jgi:hypothetical protein
MVFQHIDLLLQGVNLLLQLPGFRATKPDIHGGLKTL